MISPIRSFFFIYTFVNVITLYIQKIVHVSDYITYIAPFEFMNLTIYFVFFYLYISIYRAKKIKHKLQANYWNLFYKINMLNHMRMQRSLRAHQCNDGYNSVRSRASRAQRREHIRRERIVSHCLDASSFSLLNSITLFNFLKLP